MTSGVIFRSWLQTFLSHTDRQLEFPDGRPLFQYRVSADEYQQLHDLLVKAQTKSTYYTSYIDYTEPLFVLYAAEWWRRNYSGGRWAWRMITDSLDWECPPQVKISEIVRLGLEYWGRPLLSYEVLGNAFLLSIVLEGGLPVKILESGGSNLARYLKALLDDYATYRGSGIPTVKLAEDLARYLPKGFRRAGVYQLAASITECIDNLSGSLESRDDPFTELGRSRPGWESELPFVLDSDNARTLVNGLLQQAKISRARGSSRLRFRRLWTRSGDRWSQQTTLVLPAEISPARVAQTVNGTIAMLSDRMELTMEGGGEVRKVASLIKAGDDYSVFIYERNRLDLPVRSTDRVSCTLNAAGSYIGEMVVDGAEPVDPGLPLVMALVEGREEMELIGQGGLATRRPEVVVAIPEGCSVMDLVGESVDVEGSTSTGRLLSLRGVLKLELPDGLECVVRTSAERDSENRCRLIGDRQTSLEVEREKVFAGMPGVVMITRGGTHRPVADKDILWRPVKGGGSWVALNERKPVGEIDLRILQDGSCILSDRVSVLPEGFGFTLKGVDSATRGVIMLKNTSGAYVGAEDPSWITVNTNENDDSCEITCDSPDASRRRVPLLLRWQDGAESKLVFPFPAVGGAFLASNDIEGLSGEIPVGSIIHVTASGVSHKVADKFQLAGTLRADDVETNVSRCLNFSMPLDTRGDGVHELPLLRLFNPISQLFSFSADLDSKVVLEIISNGHQLARLYIGQFEGQLVYSPVHKVITHEAITSLVARVEEQEDDEDILLLPFAVEAEPLSASPLHEEGLEDISRWKIDQPTGGHFPPAMAMVSGRMGAIRPCVVFDTEYTRDNSVVGTSFEDAWLEVNASTRRAAMKRCMEDLDGNEDAWQILVGHLKVMRHAHPDCLDTCNVIIEEPEVLAGVFLRAGSEYVGMFEDWQNYLPFRWWQIPISVWESAFDNYRSSVSSSGATDEIVEVIMDHKRSEFSELATGIPQMRVVHECLEHGYFGAPLNGLSKEIARDQPTAVFQSINKGMVRKLFSNRAYAQWPLGAPREWWRDCLKNCGYAHEPPWLDDGGLKHRRPVLDAIVAQALFTISGCYPDRESRVLICAMRDFSPEDFDQILLTAQALFYNMQ